MLTGPVANENRASCVLAYGFGKSGYIHDVRGWLYVSEVHVTPLPYGISTVT